MLQLHLINNAQDKDGNTALHFAVLNNKPECVAMLLEVGAIPTVRNKEGLSSMHEVAKKGLTP